jgi:hypothetical protein
MILARVVECLRQRQQERPWVAGVTSLGLARALAIGERDLVRALAPAVEAPAVEMQALTYRGGYYATADFVPRLTAQQSAFFERAFGAGSPDPAPLAVELLRSEMKRSSIPELSEALETLITTGALSKVGVLMYQASLIAAYRSVLEAALHERGRLTVAEFRTLTKTSRKYAVPLLEFFDATGVTVRTGDVRVLRPVAAGGAAARAPRVGP